MASKKGVGLAVLMTLLNGVFRKASSDLNAGIVVFYLPGIIR